ncbi:MAG TPA: guanylate kinase [Candidatus Binatia bacterium]|nr:guanylate kinase [Candidatus Binatia bacterium]
MSTDGGNMGRKGCLFIVSGPSGAGKTSIAAPVLAALDRISMSVSVTTRRPRAGETDGIEYHFISEEAFERRVRAGEFAEWALVHGFRYGTSRTAIDRAIEGGDDLLLDIDVQGAEQIKRAYPDAVSVFLLPPSRERLEERLRGRGTDDEGTVQRRLDAACREIASMVGYDYVIVNEYLPAAVEQFLTIVRAERCKVVRLRDDDLARRLASFGADR